MKKMILMSATLMLAACDEQDKNTSDQKASTQQAMPLIIAHRGASALRPEHTLAAYQKAIDDGADFIEPDLVATQDGYLIARHENEIGSTTNIASLPQFASRKTTKVIDGTELNGWFTEDLSLNELKQLKARERIADIRPDNTRYNDLYEIPTLEQIIDLAEQHYKKTGKVIGLYIETKHPTYFQNKNLALEDRLLKTLAQHHYTREIAPIYLQSFEVNNLKYMSDQLKQHRSVKHAKIIQLYDEKKMSPADLAGATQYASMATAAGLKNVASYADGVGPSKDYIIDNNAQVTSFVKDAHAVGLKVHPYTFRPENQFLNSALKCPGAAKLRCVTGAEKELSLFFKAGVDGVFADDPALARQALTKYINAQTNR
ncbi:glycerophosphodiester phosphodiesterase [Acinetobacter larvae]|uniref:glycerophosphodiester phosphodiesterase n=1 Tax=Acinetobacter larvae TaxID=1789224 RepID=A0A1B2LY63_9GAMM|nr:glycerophosphodiester phosphodiesterase [Acinetobacter larvae]AOA57884.1 glycerophosphodiester phosphodiesterase [Acinetobacter larvae]